MERSTMLAMANSTISTGPFEGNSWENPIAKTGGFSDQFVRPPATKSREKLEFT